jgi:hypothetical protein
MTVDPTGRVTSNSTATAAGEAAPPTCWAASRREAVDMCELGDRRGDTLHDTAGNGVGVSVMLSIGDEPWLTGVSVDGGACVLHLRAGVQW